MNWFGIGAVAGLDCTRLFVLPFLEKSIVAQLLAGPTMTVFFVSALVFLSGVILFSVAMYRANVFPRLPILMYVIGFISYSLPTLFPDPVVRIAQVIGTLGIWDTPCGRPQKNQHRRKLIERSLYNLANHLFLLKGARSLFVHPLRKAKI